MHKGVPAARTYLDRLVVLADAGEELGALVHGKMKNRTIQRKIMSDPRQK